MFHCLSIRSGRGDSSSRSHSRSRGRSSSRSSSRSSKSSHSHSPSASRSRSRSRSYSRSRSGLNARVELRQPRSRKAMTDFWPLCQQVEKQIQVFAESFSLQIQIQLTFTRQETTRSQVSQLLPPVRLPKISFISNFIIRQN